MGRLPEGCVKYAGCEREQLKRWLQANALGRNYAKPTVRVVNDIGVAPTNA